jgi:hypothetical protein
MMDRRPFDDSFGGAAAREPSPRNIGPSSVFTSCAASRIVNGRTRTETVMDEASEAMMGKRQNDSRRKTANSEM